MYQMAIMYTYKMVAKYSKRPQNIPTLYTSRPSNIYPNRDFGFENMYSIWQPWAQPFQMSQSWKVGSWNANYLNCTLKLSPSLSKAGWPYSANFRRMVECLFLAFLKINKSSTFFGYFFPQLRVHMQKWVGLHFGRFFHWLVWPHCTRM
jgi:hypothetical protein